MARYKRKRKPIDYYMQDVPYDIIYDDNGKVLAEIYILPSYLTKRSYELGKEKNRVVSK